MPEINGISLPFIPAGGIQELKNQPVKVKAGEGRLSFDDIFKDALNDLKFSAHAKSRITGRDISLSESDMERLQNAFVKAGEKGANESLVLMDEKAFIVNVPNKTVITVMNTSQMQKDVVTDIDSAVFA